jgi:segregation and condensation protein B
MTTDPTRLVEAALFSAGKPLSVDELVQATKLKPDEVKAALAALNADFAQRETSLEVVKSGTKWAMSVKTAYSESTKMLAPPEIPRKVLKTLALIAFHQPIKQSDLKDMVGGVVYDHVHELYDRGLVTGRQEGITKILQTTERFAEYFGIDAENRDEIRTALAKAVGLDLAKLAAPSPAAPEPAAAETPPPEASDGESEAESASVAPATL